MKRRYSVIIVLLLSIMLICNSCAYRDNNHNNEPVDNLKKHQEKVLNNEEESTIAVHDHNLTDTIDNDADSQDKEVISEVSNEEPIDMDKDDLEELETDGTKILKPLILYNFPDISKKALEDWKVYQRISETKKDYNDLTQEDKDLISQFEPYGAPWNTVPPSEFTGDCMFYAGAYEDALYKIIATSNLEKQGEIEYSAIQAHDFRVDTAWVEGVDGYGIGEYISYYFKSNASHISTIAIYNGYAKNEYLYNNNGRVKKLCLYVNGRKYAILELEDTWKKQVFNVEPLKSTIEGIDLILTFEILEVYQGNKCEDTCIADINFSEGGI
ncbi:MAG: hypothetical protein N4A63_08970 [Vallitalea sp.]|jgi:hypothetical protein|nr:hypothetical protein [Vallitalea sp.]